ncbi:hypothetical protein E0712_08775 [Lactobacillus helveticus]|uniref:hypothetical protein n=1 Tax=Lactobacillus helveticus TaxID=1587 RepID=UPI001C64F9EF|nr:hypothetical protein [Lactobacillus helveticus]MBW8014474.1 hypothetical protein [Lactobacillus helveticus]
MTDVKTIKVISDSSDYEVAKAQIESAIQAQENLKKYVGLQNFSENADSGTRKYSRKIIRDANSEIDRLQQKYSEIKEEEKVAKEHQAETNKKLDNLVKETEKKDLESNKSNNFNDLLAEHEKMGKEIVLLRQDQELQTKKLEKTILQTGVLIAIVVIISIAIHGFTHQMLKC